MREFDAHVEALFNRPEMVAMRERSRRLRGEIPPPPKRTARGRPRLAEQLAPQLERIREDPRYRGKFYTWRLYAGNGAWNAKRALRSQIPASEGFTFEASKAAFKDKSWLLVRYEPRGVNR